MIFVMMFGCGLRECFQGSVDAVDAGMEIGVVVNRIFPMRAAAYKCFGNGLGMHRVSTMAKSSAVQAQPLTDVMLMAFRGAGPRLL
jgi:hypothetical protein